MEVNQKKAIADFAYEIERSRLTQEMKKEEAKIKLIEKQEAAKEEGDSEGFIKSVKQAQSDYQGKLKGILTDKQSQTYNELREAAIMDMMKDLAEIKLLDIQLKVGFSDEQLEKLVPVMATSMRGFMKIA